MRSKSHRMKITLSNYYSGQHFNIKHSVKIKVGIRSQSPTLSGLCKGFLSFPGLLLCLSSKSSSYPQHPSSSRRLFLNYQGLLRSKISSYPDVVAYTSNPALGKGSSGWLQYENPSLRKTKNQTQNKTTQKPSRQWSGNLGDRQVDL